MRYRDFIQNITITFLALLSLFLFSRTQFFQLGAAAGSGTWQRLTAPVSDQISDAPSSDTLSAPVRAAVTGEYGRYGSISLTTDSESFTPIKTLLREVLGSARSRMDSSAAAFRSALGKPSVYCDFLEPLPVSYLADLMGITAESELSVRDRRNDLAKVKTSIRLRQFAAKHFELLITCRGFLLRYRVVLRHLFGSCVRTADRIVRAACARSIRGI